MNATEAISRIKDLLGFSFKAEKFYSTVLVDGKTEVTNNKDTEGFEIGDELFIVNESTLSPAPEGMHEVREGLIITLNGESKIVKIEEKTKEEESSETEVETEIENESTDMMSSSVLADGTKIETDTEGEFKVGDQLYFITESGEKVKAPAGEHTTESGIVIVTDGEGIITGVKYPDSEGTGSLEDYKKEMDKMKEAMSEMVGLLSELNKFKTDFESIKADFEEFKKQPDRVPVVEKKFSTQENILDWKLELIKGGFNKK